MVANIQRFVSLYDGQQGGYRLKDIKQHKIKLPVKGGKIDFDFMESFISAIQKLVIKDVVLYKDKKIESIKKIVNKQNQEKPFTK